jgi:hypothetical protein
VQEEQETNQLLGVSSWLASGLQLEETQSVNYTGPLHVSLKSNYRIKLREFVRRLGGMWSPANRLEVAKRRERLRARIDTFNRTGLMHLRHAEDIEEIPDNIKVLDDEASDDEEDPFLPSAEDLFTGEPELRPLFMPSTLGYEKCAQLKLQRVADKEIALREGQANDALDGLRSGIGEKSFRYRQQLRHAKGKIQSTRARSAIYTVGRELNHYRRVYGFARRALIALGAESAENSERYKPVLLRDLQTSTIIFDLNAPGQRNRRLAWFWSTPGLGEEAENNLLTECE